MNAGLSRALVRLYPRRWRERYGTEFEAMLQDGHGDMRALTNVFWSALGERIFPTVANRGEGATSRNSFDSRFHFWRDRAPWAMFGLTPPLLLAAAYFVAGSILWSGWRIFLPGTNTPFVRINGFAIVYFGIGRMLYYGAPVLVGWALVIVAIRQKLKLAWPAAGLVVVAVLGAAVQVQASRAASGTAQVSMGLRLGNSIQEIRLNLIHTVVILLIAAVPYLIWRVQRSRTRILST